MTLFQTGRRRALRAAAITLLTAAAALSTGCSKEHVIDRDEVMGTWRGPIPAEDLALLGFQPGPTPGELELRFAPAEVAINGAARKVTYTGVNNGLMISPAGSKRVFTIRVQDRQHIHASFAGVDKPVAVGVDLTRVE